LVGGPNLAAQALVAGLVDELALFVWPVVLGGRNPALPTDTRADLELSSSRACPIVCVTGRDGHRLFVAIRSP
jgi:riboflavin biosynthesis pyrimidine reductase